MIFPEELCQLRKNGGQHEIIYSMNRDIEQMLSVTAEIADEKQKTLRPIEHMGKGCSSNLYAFAP